MYRQLILISSEYTFILFALGWGYVQYLTQLGDCFIIFICLLFVEIKILVMP